MSLYFTDSFKSWERDTIPYLTTRIGRDWDGKEKAFKKKLTQVQALEEELKYHPILPLWYKIKKAAASQNHSEREIFNFRNLAAANVFMLLQVGRTDIIERWANQEITWVFAE